MKKLYLVLITWLLGSMAYSQTQLWYYGYNSGGSEEARDIVYGSDGYVYVSGYTQSGAMYQMVVIKLNKSGEQQWVYTYGGASFSDVEVDEMLIGDDGNIYVCGYIRNYTNNHKFAVISVSPEGSLRWDYVYDPDEDYFSEAYSIAYDNGTLYAAGMVDYNFFVAAIEPGNGSQKWIYWFDGSCPYLLCDDEAVAICTGNDGTIYTAGYTSSTTDKQLAVVSLTPEGDENWRYLEPTYNIGPSSPSDIVFGQNEMIYVSCHQMKDAGVMCLNKQGELQWKHLVDGPGPEPYYAERINQILYGIDGNIYTCGTTGGRNFNVDSDLDMTVLKFTPGGELDWFYRYEGLYGFYDIGNAIVQTPDTNLHVAAYVSGPLPEADMFTIHHSTGRDLFTLRFIGPTVDADVGYAITADEDGYVYYAGYNYTGSSYRDIFTWKVDPPRNSDGYYDFGGNGTAGQGRCIIAANDTCTVIAGRHGVAFNAYTDMQLIKTDINGDTLWTRYYGGELEDVANNVIQCADGGFLVTGYTTSFGAGGSDLYIVKTDATGMIEWEKTYGFESDESGATAVQTGDGGYMIGATSQKYGNGGDMWIVKIDAAGDSLWTRWYGGEKTDYVAEIYPTIDGNYILVGSIGHAAGVGYLLNAYVMKLNPMGDTLWTREYDYPEYSDKGNDIYVFDDGTYLLAGFYHNHNWLARLNASGDTLWTRKYGDNHWAGFEKMTRDTNGNFTMSSNHITHNMVHFTTVDPQGNVIEDDTLMWSSGYTLYSAAASVTDVCPNHWGGFMATGRCKISGNIMNWNTFLYRKGGKLTLLPSPLGIKEVPMPSKNLTNIQVNAFPNPFAHRTDITFELTQPEWVNISIADISGRVVYSEPVRRYSPGNHTFTWLPEDVTPGIYFCRIQAGTTIFSGKLIHSK